MPIDRQATCSFSLSLSLSLFPALSLSLSDSLTLSLSLSLSPSLSLQNTTAHHDHRKSRNSHGITFASKHSACVTAMCLVQGRRSDRLGLAGGLNPPPRTTRHEVAVGRSGVTARHPPVKFLLAAPGPAHVVTSPWSPSWQPRYPSSLCRKHWAYTFQNALRSLPYPPWNFRKSAPKWTSAAQIA